jgi:hypothetical protein
MDTDTALANDSHCYIECPKPSRGPPERQEYRKDLPGILRSSLGHSQIPDARKTGGVSKNVIKSLYASNLEEAKPTCYLLMHFDFAFSSASVVPCSGLDTAHSGKLEPTLSNKGLHNKWATVSAQLALYTDAAQRPARANTKLTDRTSGHHMHDRRCPCTCRAAHCSVAGFDNQKNVLTSCTRCVRFKQALG